MEAVLASTLDSSRPIAQFERLRHTVDMAIVFVGMSATLHIQKMVFATVLHRAFVASARQHVCDA